MNFAIPRFNMKRTVFFQKHLFDVCWYVRDSGVILDGEVLSANHAIALEPFATELLRGAIRGVRPLDSDAVVVRVLKDEDISC